MLVFSSNTFYVRGMGWFVGLRDKEVIWHQSSTTSLGTKQQFYAVLLNKGIGILVYFVGQRHVPHLDFWSSPSKGQTNSPIHVTLLMSYTWPDPSTNYPTWGTGVGSVFCGREPLHCPVLRCRGCNMKGYLIGHWGYGCREKVWKWWMQSSVLMIYSPSSVPFYTIARREHSCNPEEG